jgi:dephospho-CoA kinase
MPIESNNLYKKIEALQKIEAAFGDELTEDQKKIVNSALGVIEKEIAKERSTLSYKAKLNPFNDDIKRSIDSISYNTLNIRHIRVKLGIKTSSVQVTND